MTELYRISLNNRIKAGKVHLNNKQTVVTGYEERGADSIVIVEDKEHVLIETYNLITNGHETKRTA